MAGSASVCPWLAKARVIPVSTLQSCKLSNSRAKPCQNVTPWCYGSLWLIQPILFLPVRGLLSMTSTTHCVRPGECPGQEIAGNENPPSVLEGPQCRATRVYRGGGALRDYRAVLFGLARGE